MRRIVAAITLALLAVPSPGLSTGSFSVDESTNLQSVSVTIEASGRVRYHFAALANSSAYTGEGVWDPLTRRADEALKELSGNVIQSRATCDADPWLVAGAPCTDGFVSSKGLSAGMENFVNNMKAPIGANLLSANDRARVKDEFDRAVAAKAAADKVAADKAAAEARKQAAIKALLAEKTTKEKVSNQSILAALAPTAVPVAQLHSSKAGLLVRTPPPLATSPTPTRPPAPAANPPFGATYAPGLLAQIRVNQPATVSVTVKNGSSQTWPANGAFRLSYHWYQGGVLTVFDGMRTMLTAAVPPGGQVTLAANVRGPAWPGSYTIKWDMVQESVSWFSNRGVPTADRPVNAVP
jgi:hypothetical protein